MMSKYHHLTYDQKCQIYILIARKDSKTSIAKALKVHPSTISREILRNKGEKGYRFKQAHQKSISKRNSKPNQKLREEVVFRDV